MRGSLLAVRLVLAAVLFMPATASAAPDLLGLWQVRDGRAQVKVAKCGPSLCARIVWLQQPNDDNGKPLTDGNNANPELRKRPILQLPIAYEMVPQDGDRWTGIVYDPERGKAYDGSMTLLPDGRLQVKGCLAFLCESDFWSRCADDGDRGMKKGCQTGIPLRRHECAR